MLYYSLVQPHPDFRLRLLASDACLLRLEFDEVRPEAGWTRNDDHPLLRQARRQLEQYFEGRRREFDLPLGLRGTPFQERVWRALLEIPYGETRSYGQIARALGVPRGARAVGGANHANPLAIVVPCHRVIASDATLGGYGGGLERKRFLLELESRSAR